MCLCMYVYTYRIRHACTYISAGLSLYLSTYLTVCPSVYLSVYSSTYLSIPFFAYPPVDTSLSSFCCSLLNIAYLGEEWDPEPIVPLTSRWQDLHPVQHSAPHASPSLQVCLKPACFNNKGERETPHPNNLMVCSPIFSAPIKEFKEGCNCTQIPGSYTTEFKLRCCQSSPCLVLLVFDSSSPCCQSSGSTRLFLPPTFQ